MGKLRRLWDRLTGREVRDMRDRMAAQAKALNETYNRMRPWLAGVAPGQWASDHYEETKNHHTGWTYSAVRAIARQSSQAVVAVHQTGGSPEVRAYRAAKRAARKLIAQTAADLRLGLVTPGTADWRRSQALARVKDAESAINPTGTETDRRPLPDSHPYHRLLKRPNPGQSGSIFLFGMAQQIELTGTCYTWQIPNGLGVPVERYILPTALVFPQAPSQDHPTGSYRVSPANSYATAFADEVDGTQWALGAASGLFTLGGVLDARHVRAYRWPHPLYLSDGLSPLSAGSLWVDTAEQVDRARWSSMTNGSKPGMVFNEDGSIDSTGDDRAGFEEQIAALNAGAQNQGKNLYVPRGLTATPWATSPAEMDYTAAFLQLRDALFALHGVAPVAAGVTEAGSYSAFYAALQQTVELTVQPLLSLFAEEDNEFLAPQFGRGIETAYHAKAINDPELLLKKLGSDVAARAITKNEYRMLRGLAPTKEPWGDEIVGQDDAELLAKLAGKPGAGQNTPADRQTTGLGDPTRQAQPAANGNGKHHAGRF